MDGATAPSGRSGLLAGLAAGFIALACCVGPAVGALLGLVSAATAIGLATDLYSTWGWAFKLAGVGFAAGAVVVAFRGSRSCDASGRGRFRFLTALVISGLATYGVLYAATTWLGDAASPVPEITVTGETPQERVVSALVKVREHYPHFTAEVEGVSPTGIRLQVGWRDPDLDAATEGYGREVSRRVEDSREATFVVLRAIAASNRTMESFSAYEDRMFIPIWSRSQILGIADPRDYRDFERYTEFQFSAAERSGYASIFDDGW